MALKFRIHYEIEDWKDHIDIGGETIEDIKEIANKELEKRGLDVVKNNVWSEEI